MKDMYDVILKRKSVRQYRDELVFTESELDAIREQFSKLVPLDGSIRTCFEIVPVEETDATVSYTHLSTRSHSEHGS